MANLNYVHPPALIASWPSLSLPMQMANIGSEVGRAIKYRRLAKEHLAKKAFVRALELLDLSVDAAIAYDREHQTARSRELCRLREEWRDYFVGDNQYHTDPDRLINYYNQYVSLRWIINAFFA